MKMKQKMMEKGVENEPKIPTVNNPIAPSCQPCMWAEPPSLKAAIQYPVRLVGMPVPSMTLGNFLDDK